MNYDCNTCDNNLPLRPGDLPRVPRFHNPEIVDFHTVEISAERGTDEEGQPFAPQNGMYKNTLVVYLANDHKYLYNSDGIPTKIYNGETQTAPLYHSLGSNTDGAIDQKVVTDALDGKQSKISGKGLSTNDYTTADKTKLAGIEAGAEKNAPNTVIDASYVHTDNNYTTADKTKLAGIEDGAEKNAPNTVIDATYVHTDNNYVDADKNKLAGIEAGAEKNDPDTVVDALYVHTDNNYTTGDKDKLAGIASGAEVNVQSDYAQADATADDYIKNKPTNVSAFTNDAGYQTATEVDTKDTAVTTALETKIDENVMTSLAVDSTALATTLKLTNGKKNLKTGVTSSDNVEIPLADATKTGVINSGTYSAIANNTTKIQALQDGTVVITGLPASPTQAEVTDAWKAASGLTTPFSSAKAYDQTNRKVWTYYGNSNTWEAVLADGGTVTVNQFTNGALGTVKGSTADGKVGAELDGTGSVNGWTTLKNAVDTNTADVATLQTEVAGKEGTIPAGTTGQYYRGDKSWQTLDKTAVGLNNVDNTSDADKKTNFTGTLTTGDTGFAVAGDVKDALDNKQDKIAMGTTDQYLRGDGSWQTLDKTAVGLSQVDNTSDATKKTNFTGSITAGNTGFVTGGDVQSALDNKADASSIGDGTLTIQKNGTAVDTFKANASTDKSINIKTLTATDTATAGIKQLVDEDGNNFSVEIADNSVTTAKIADSAVTTAKINDKAVTSDKIDWTSTRKTLWTGDGAWRASYTLSDSISKYHWIAISFAKTPGTGSTETVITPVKDDGSISAGAIGYLNSSTTIDIIQLYVCYFIGSGTTINIHNPGFFNIFPSRYETGTTTEIVITKIEGIV